MPYKNKEDAQKYYQEYYFKKFGHYPKPLVRKTKEEKAKTKLEWNKNNQEKCSEYARKSRLKHKKQRAIDYKKWVEKNYEYHLKYHKKYNKKWYKIVENKKLQDKRGAAWQKNNPEKIKVIQDKYKKSHSEKIAEGFIHYRKTLKGRWRVLKGSAVKRNYKVDISFEEFALIVSEPCIYCGEEKKRIGIDRIDNSIGYTKENSAPCCATCNMMKKIMSVEEFLKHIKKIHKYNT